VIFRRTIYMAICVGVVAGLLLSVVQVLTVNPIILAAEAFETGSTHPGGVDEHNHNVATDDALIHDKPAYNTHTHGDSWAPDDGLERTSFTVFTNILAGIGFAAILLSLMSQLQLQGITQLSLPKGILWGGAGFIAVFLAPAIGLPPEIPGIQAAALELRQLWWVLTVVAVASGLLVFVFVTAKYKLMGVVLMAIPYLVTIPHYGGPAFIHSNPEVVLQLTQLHEQFIIASALSNLLFWCVLGTVSAWGLNRWVLKGLSGEAGHHSHASV